MQTATLKATSLARILIVDDEQIIRESLQELLESEGYSITTAADGVEALALLDKESFDLMLCDIQMPRMDGVTLFEKSQQRQPSLFVMLITAYGTVETAVEAFKKGACDYLLKPLRLDEVAAKVKNILRYRNLYLENQQLRKELHPVSPRNDLIGDSPLMKSIYLTIAKVAKTRTTILIVGESGTGKELIARAIHQESNHPEQKFLAINCAAIPEDLLENQLFGHRRGAYTGADRDSEGMFLRVGKGTLFLDEIGEMSLATQAKLLRAIEQKEVLPVGASEPITHEARILAATNKDLGRAVEEKKFREDLYYRLNIVTIALPPLRDRREDIPALVQYLLARQGKELGKRIAAMDPDALKVLRTAIWKGNIRELDNILQRAVILCEENRITLADLPSDLQPDPQAASSEDLREAVSQFEKAHITKMLRNISDKKEAARRLGLAISSLYRKIEELGIDLEEAQPTN